MSTKYLLLHHREFINKKMFNEIKTNENHFVLRDNLQFYILYHVEDENDLLLKYANIDWISSKFKTPQEAITYLFEGRDYSDTSLSAYMKNFGINETNNLFQIFCYLQTKEKQLTVYSTEAEFFMKLDVVKNKDYYGFYNSVIKQNYETIIHYIELDENDVMYLKLLQ